MSSHRDTSSLAQSIPAYSGGHLLQSLTRTRSMRSDHTRQRRHSGDDQTIDEIQIQVGEAALDEADSVRTKDGSAEKGKRWSMTDDLIDLQAKYADSATMVRKLGVTFNNLTVKASQTGVTYQETVLSQFVPRFSTPGQSGQQQVILDNVHGCVKPGEMLLVLGRPGAGCTSLLRMLCNHREGYGHVSGDVKYGNMSSKEAKRYQGQIIMNTEEEIFFPTLTVGQTMDFATRMKVPLHLPKGANSPEEAARVCRDFLLKSMGITHTKDTMVGNEFVRGVSGGERKRVSIVECMATRGSVFCWDNSTRGLDASTALEWTKAMRAMTDVLGLTTIVTLYQAGNGIYDLFDKVLILDEGKQLYYGPRQEAVPFMNELGFYCDPAANKGDFLTGVCVPTERKILEGYESTFPRTNTDIREAYQGSPIRSTMEAEYGYPSSKEAKENTAEFQAIVAGEKARFLPKKSTLTTSFTAQVLNCIVRQYQIMWGDKVTFIIKQVCALIQALVCGSLFYNAPDNSSGLFLKGGALFFGVLYNSLMAMSEVTDSFTGRPVMAKHRAFSLYHPAAFCIAQVVADIPVLLFQITHFGIILYFMAGLKNTADAFFTFWAVLFATTMCMTAMFRACGAAFPTFDSASKVSGGLINASVMYAGYMIHKPDMHPWFVWIYWINPLAYAFESLMGTEFRHATIPCVGPNVIPNGPGDWPNRSCAGISGAVQGADFVTGEQYLGSLSYNDSRVWRNFGIIWAWWLFYIAATIFFTCRWRQQGQGGSNLLVPRTLQRKQVDIEDVPTSTQEKSSGRNVAVNGDGKTRNGADLVRNTSIFTWKNLTYTVKTQSGERKLLDNVQGWVKPGMLAALMGTSGAGKTTLLDVLAQRKTDGTIHGSILVDGRPLSVSFQRSAGYCEQLDVHESFATVREALEFSALLRQPRDVPREEKLAYVDTIIDLLELHDLEHTLIGKVGAGLTIEQRKRVTIGVELVSKPSIIIFLDEPTSGLDGQAAYNTVRFLRKLADVGQAVLVTIHQPSAQLFAQFDSLLLLAKGGKTVYFGDIGEDAKTIKEYFGKRGAPCPEDCNPAEHMIDVVSGTMSQSKDWNEVWLASDEHAKVVKQLDMMIETAANKPPGYKEDGREFATSLWEQTRIVTKRMNVALFRDTEYINSKFTLHIICALFNGFTFWKIGDGVSELQLKLFSIFNFIFVAPGVIAQLQPLFIDRRDIFETREKKSKMYHWAPFVTGLIVSELPYLVLCAIVYFCCWYFTVGFDGAAKYAGSTLFCMIFYEFLYTGMGQFIAAYAPNAVFATLVNPLVIGMLVCFCGVLVPYSQIQEFWRYWIYWINPFNYLIGALLTFALWDKPVNCKPGEFALFNPPSGQTCAAYLTSYLQNSPGANLVNPDAVEGCKVCQYTMGSDYLKTVNIKHYYYGWRDNAIVVLFCFSSYGLVYLFLKLRTKRSKKAE